MNHTNFRTALYVTLHDLQYINSAHPQQLEQAFDFFQKHVRLDKVYLETYRADTLIEKETILKAKEMFKGLGMETAGGITICKRSLNTKVWSFLSFCYTDEKNIDELKNLVAFTAGLFDEIILDDFYFNNCKCSSCIAKKGQKSWTEFRLELMSFVTKEILIKTARQVNPNVKLVIKYPNWYDEYQYTGYNLEKESAQFDMIYTGTETRDPYHTQQTLQRYTSYFIMRYLENVKPGKNNGGWFDNIDCLYNLGSYAEQIYLTLFAKAREVTLFSLGMHYLRSMFVPVAGYALDRADRILRYLGNPVGLTCYKPFHSAGEKYLHGYLGMIGLPLEPQPEAPVRSALVLLTESAQADPQIVDFIKQQLLAGKNVLITSGLLNALQDRGFSDIVEMQYTSRKAAVLEFACYTKECAFKGYYQSAREVLIPEIEFATNDCVQMIVALKEHKNFPLLLRARYGEGRLYVLTIPDNPGDLYLYPPEVLNVLRHVLMENADAGSYVSLEGPGQISLFTYDNNTFVIESFLPHNQTVKIIINKEGAELEDLEFGHKITGWTAEGKTYIPIDLPPSHFIAFSYK